jgi:cation-transporting ATPase E
VTSTVLERGLSSAEVAERIAAGQVNTLPPRSGRTTWDIVKANVFTRINFLLMVLFVMVISTGALFNALFGCLIIFNSIVGMLQELKAKKTLDNLAVISEGKPTVRRDGESVQIQREEIVLGDLIEIGPGDQIVVDGDVVEASYLEVDESLLTGESDAINKEVGSHLMSGSHVIAGVGAFRATKVGPDSYAAQITAEANKFSLTKSELQGGINFILKLITWLMVPVAIVTVWGQWNIGGEEDATWQSIVLRISGALVPMVPEGLVLLTSLAFAAGVVRLSRQSVLIQELPAIEGLARVDVVCADKTGTLTENGMKFAELQLFADELDEPAIGRVLAQLAASDPRPNASMQAIADEFSLGDAEPWQITALAPFTSAKKWSGASFDGHGSWVLGAADILVPGSGAATEAEGIGAEGRRVLLLGQTAAQVDAVDAPGAVTPVALVILDQRVRPEARDTLAYFEDQGVQVKVISGDNAKSVGAVIAKLGITEQEVVDARILPEDEGLFADEVEENNVFGRVTPQQKRQMVAALQSKGHAVAMTGDGVNDVLAIKDSDLGVAMGSGASATRAVAQVVLMNDDFSTLPSVVAEGRRVIGNIERVANFFLTKTLYSIVLALLLAVRNLPLPFLPDWQLAFPFMPIHISMVGWFTIGIPACILAMAPNKERARHGFLGRVMRFGIPSGLIISATVFAAYLMVMPNNATEAQSYQASTAALLTLLMGGAWVMVTTSRPYQWWKIGMILFCFALIIVFYLLPIDPALGYGQACQLTEVGIGTFLSHAGQCFFWLDPTNPAMMTTGLIWGGIAIIGVELTWWIDGILSGKRRRVFALSGEE